MPTCQRECSRPDLFDPFLSDPAAKSIAAIRAVALRAPRPGSRTRRHPVSTSGRAGLLHGASRAIGALSASRSWLSIARNGTGVRGRFRWMKTNICHCRGADCGNAAANRCRSDRTVALELLETGGNETFRRYRNRRPARETPGIGLWTTAHTRNNGKADAAKMPLKWRLGWFVPVTFGSFRSLPIWPSYC